MTENFDETAAIQRWEREPAIRDEFNQDRAAWLAYCRAEAEGRFKVQGGRRR